MVRFKAILQKFSDQGEKTGWTYITVPSEIAHQLIPNKRTSYRVKGRIDAHPIEAVSLLPMGEGDFIIAVNAAMRRGIKKPLGASVQVELSVDKKGIVMPADLQACLDDDPEAKAFFSSLTNGHRNYFIKWLDSAKTDITRTKRIAEMLNALSQKKGFPEMLRSRKKDILK